MSVKYWLRFLVMPSMFISAINVEGEEPCRQVSIESMKYSICTFDNTESSKQTLRTFLKAKDGTPYGTFSRLRHAMDDAKTKLSFACNGSASQSDLTPVGLYIEDAIEIVPIVKPTDEGLGNLYIRPNGIFFVEGHKANVVTTETYIAAKPKATFANQSGPMLIIDGEVSARLDPHGTSLKTRNAVCVTADSKKVLFVLSEQAQNFFSFAGFLKTQGCKNALNLDVTTSTFYAPSIGKADLWVPMGAMIGVIQAGH